MNDNILAVILFITLCICGILIKKHFVPHKYYSMKVKEIKEILSQNEYPPVFQKKKWKRLKVNCYAYALDINVSDPKEQIWCPGCICDKNADKNIRTDVTNRVKRDLEFLEISYRKNTKELKEGEWRIAIYFQPAFHDCSIGFHISRQDKDGIWSEKPSWTASIRKIGKKSNIPPDLSKYNIRLENVLILSKK